MQDATRRDWLSFEHEGATYLFDLTFLGSNWRCIFGAGCRGIHETDSTGLGHGCCSHGAYFADKADRRRVRDAIASLTDEQWQFRSLAEDLGGAIARNDDGEWMTRTHDGACILLNRAEHPRGLGCALHVAAIDDGVSHVGYKPEVCWQLPLRLTFHTDEVDHTTYTLREWHRRDWGEGGEEFHWWCTEGPEAFTSQDRVVDSMREEIIGLVGDDVYRRLLAEMELAPAVTAVPHPARRVSA